MGKMVQLRNMPEKLHRIVKSRAALKGMSLSDYLIAEIKKGAERPTNEELMERLATRTPVKTRLSPAQMIREERDRR
jgi:plasmid stability protein